VRAEVWHAQQRTIDLPDGGLELHLPYAAAAELEMDILRHGEHVEVIAPQALRDRIAARLAQAARAYRKRAAPKVARRARRPARVAGESGPDTVAPEPAPRRGGP
jgi:hypothetical protein